MNIMVTWRVDADKRHETLALFAEMKPEQEQTMMGKGVKLVSRWHDVVGGAGVAIFEADSAEALSAYALNWNRFMDLNVSVVVDDDTTRKIGRNMRS
jgi:hypothetical protein